MVPFGTAIFANPLGLAPWLIIGLVVLLLFGANRLPELMRSLGRSATEFKKGLKEGSDDDEKKKVENAEKVEKP